MARNLHACKRRFNDAMIPSYSSRIAHVFEGTGFLKYLLGIMSSVLMIHIHPIIFHAIDGAVRIRFTHFLYDDCENKSTLF